MIYYNLLHIIIFFVRKDLKDYVLQVSLHKIWSMIWLIQIILYRENIKEVALQRYVQLYPYSSNVNKTVSLLHNIIQKRLEKYLQMEVKRLSNLDVPRTPHVLHSRLSD